MLNGKNKRMPRKQIFLTVHIFVYYSISALPSFRHLSTSKFSYKELLSLLIEVCLIWLLFFFLQLCAFFSISPIMLLYSLRSLNIRLILRSRNISILHFFFFIKNYSIMRSLCVVAFCSSCK